MQKQNPAKTRSPVSAQCTKGSSGSQDQPSVRPLQKALQEQLHKDNSVSNQISEDINQNLAAMKLCIARTLQGPPEIKTYRLLLADIDYELSQLIAQLRTISEDLHTPDVGKRSNIQDDD